MAETYRHELNAVPHNFSKIVFGTAKLKNLQKVYSDFRIPSNEDIVAYIKSAVPFAGLLIVITDQAIYSFLDGRFPFSAICSYVVTQEDIKASVFLKDAQKEYSVLGGTFIAQNIAGQEIRTFITSMQKQLVRNYAWAKQQRDELMRSLSDAAHTRMRTGRIDAHLMSLLNVLERETSYCDAVTLLKGEDIFRTCHLSEYRSFLNKLPTNVSAKTRADLQNNQDKFEASLIKDLSNLSLNFDNNFLTTAYTNLSTLIEFSLPQCMILAYVCIRAGKEEQFETAKERLVQRAGIKQVQELLFFKGQYYNTRMQSVYHAILNDTVPDKEHTGWTDSLGLTPLHYAILLRKEEIVAQLLQNGTWKMPVASTNKDVPTLLDYTTVACLANLPDRVDVFRNTSPLVIAQLRSKKALEKKLWLKRRKLDIQDAAAKQAKETIRLARKNNLPDKWAEYEEKLTTVLELREDTLAQIDELQQSISEIEHEIRSLTEDAMIDAADTLQRLRTSRDPLIQYIFRLLTDSDYLYHVLADSKGECRLYSCDGLSFVTPIDVDLNIPHWESGRGKRNESNSENTSKDTGDTKKGTESRSHTDEPIVKPYGNSWFSPEAHRDMKKLKEEYRKLAKQYHPDVCAHVRSKEIFQAILNERADILEQMSN